MTAAPDYETAAASDDALDVRVWLRLLSCSNMIENEVRRRLRREFGVTLPWFDAMAQLYRAPDGLSMSELSRRLMVSNGNVTGLVDRLVAEGHVERRAAPEDQRIQRARLTRKGRAAFQRMYPAHRRWISELMADAAHEDLAKLHRMLGRVKDSVLRGLAAPSSNRGGTI